MEVDGANVGLVLHAVFGARPDLRLFVLEEHGELRPHIVVFVDGQPVHDRKGLSDSVRPSSQVYIMQALSGG
jgi:hypothetical protein